MAENGQLGAMSSRAVQEQPESAAPAQEPTLKDSSAQNPENPATDPWIATGQDHWSRGAGVGSSHRAGPPVSYVTKSKTGSRSVGFS